METSTSLCLLLVFATKPPDQRRTGRGFQVDSVMASHLFGTGTITKRTIVLRETSDLRRTTCAVLYSNGGTKVQQNNGLPASMVITSN